jgi:hypothetical protein
MPSKLKLKLFSFLTFLVSFLACDILKSDPDAACTYGPSDNSNAFCVETTQSDCDDNFHGSWHEGQECP